MTETQKTRIKGYVTKLNEKIADSAKLDLVVETVADRVLLYLNETEIPQKIERVIAEVIVSVYTRTEAVQEGENQSVSTVSDNGQSVTYRVSPTQYMTSKSDQELFTGFERLLNPYRRIHVITE